MGLLHLRAPRAVSAAALADQHLLLTHPENRVTLVTLGRPLLWSQWGRLAALEPRVAVWELPGPSTRRTERRLSLPPAAAGAGAGGQAAHAVSSRGRGHREGRPV